MELLRFIIKSQKDLYIHKFELLSFGLKYNHKQQYYYNPFELSYSSEEHLITLLKTYGYEFEIKKETELDFLQKIEFVYKITPVDEKTSFISKRRNNEHIYMLNNFGDKINIMNLSSGASLSSKVKVKEFQENNNLPIMVLDLLNSCVNDFTLLNQILSILVESNNQELQFLHRLNAFKYHVFGIVKEKMQGNFICNCVDGFFPETRFYLKGNQIFSDYLCNYVSVEQEQKILKYLFVNRKYIGVEKIPTIHELFVNKKIIVSNRDGTTSKVLINKVDLNKNSGKLKVRVFNGNTNHQLQKEFTQEELSALIKYSRSV